MGRKRSLGDSEEEKYHGEMEGEVESEEGDANQDLSLGILAKASHRQIKRNRSFEKGLSTEIRTPNGAELSVDLPRDEDDDPLKKGVEAYRTCDGSNETNLTEEYVVTAKGGAVLETTSGIADAADGIGEGNKKKKKNKKKKTTDDQNGGLPPATVDAMGTATKMGEADDNIVMRKLLRGPRYFDPPEEWEQWCYNCGEPGHVSANCVVERRKRPCYVCGNLGHDAKDCLQGMECFACKKVGHYAKNCPEKRSNAERCNNASIICLRCGDSGHDLLSCRNEYRHDDLKEVQCYICKHFGHLCCVDVMGSCPRELSCYNCGEKGHTGLGCAKSRGNGNGGTAKTCYKCGEEGHLARGCSRDDNFDQWMGDPATPSNAWSQEDTGFFGFRSVPHDFGKLPQWTDMQAERRKSVSSREFRSRSGWRGDNAKHWTHATPHRMDRWDSPPERVGFKGQEIASDSNEQYSNAQIRKKPKFSPYNPNGSRNSNGYQKKFTASKPREYRRRDGWRE